MKVLHVESGRHLYGGALQVVWLMRGLAARGIENRLACPVDAAIAAAAAPHAVGVHRIAMRGDLDLRTVFRLRRLIRAERPDLVHLHSRFGTEIWGALAARAEGVPVVHSRRVDNPEPAIWARRKYRLYDRVIAISNGVRDVLLTEGVAAGKVAVVHSAVDLDRYRPAGGDRPALASEFALGPATKTVAMVAQFIPRKGHATLIDALPAILDAEPAARVLLFGQGPGEAAVRAQVARRGLGGAVIFAGFRDDLPRLLPGVDLLLHPAASEGLGVSLLQAAACGVPIVASAVGGIPEVVADRLTGELVPPGDAPALAAATIRLLGDRALRRRYGEAARLRMADRFSVDAMVEGNLAVYRDLLHGR